MLDPDLQRIHLVYYWAFRIDLCVLFLVRIPLLIHLHNRMAGSEWGSVALDSEWVECSLFVMRQSQLSMLPSLNTIAMFFQLHLALFPERGGIRTCNMSYAGSIWKVPFAASCQATRQEFMLPITSLMSAWQHDSIAGTLRLPHRIAKPWCNLMIVFLTIPWVILCRNRPY